MELAKSVETLEAEAAELERELIESEREVRAPLAIAVAEHELLKQAVAEEEARLAAYEVELQATKPRVVLTPLRSVLAAAAIGTFTLGAAAADVDLTKVSVGLLAGVWVAFLAGALRGK